MKRHYLITVVCTFALLTGALLAAPYVRPVIVHNNTDTPVSAKVSQKFDFYGNFPTKPEFIKSISIPQEQVALLLKINCFAATSEMNMKTYTIEIEGNQTTAKIELKGILDICPKGPYPQQDPLKITVEKNQAGELILSTDKQFEIPESLLPTKSIAGAHE